MSILNFSPRGFFIGFFIFFIRNINAELIETYSVGSQPVNLIRAQSSEEMIIFIDVDAIARPASQIFSHDSPDRDFINNLIALSNRDKKYVEMISAWFDKRKLVLLEEGWIDFVSSMHNSDAKIYGVCALPIRITNLEQKRYLTLKQLGIKFTDRVYRNKLFAIDQNLSWPSLFYNGIVFTGSHSIPNTILSFLKVTNHVPAQLIFITSSKSDLLNLSKKLKRFDIEYKGILYLAIRNSKGIFLPEIAKLQKTTLMNHNRWIEDAEAEDILEDQK